MSGDLPRARRRLDDIAEDLRPRYLQALRSGDGMAATAVLREALAARLGAAATYTRIVQPAMAEVGRLWERGELSVADEHLASGITMRALAAVYPQVIEAAPRGGPRVLLASVGGELHSIGIRMIADVLEGAGFETIDLGADTPAEQVAGAVARHAPRLVALSVTMPLYAAELERAVLAAGETDPTVSVMIGGQGVPGRLRSSAAYVPDAESVVATARRLVAAGPSQPTVASRDWLAPDARAPLADPIERETAQSTARLADLARAEVRRVTEHRLPTLRDDLTGLPNRRAWEDHYGDLVDAAGATVLLIDLDGIGAANRREGHLAGDLILERAGAAIRAVLRADDFAARLGGDEFGVVLPAVGLDDAVLVAERIRRRVGMALAASEVTASIGVAAHAGARRATTLAAGEAVCRAKARGGDTVERA